MENLTHWNALRTPPEDALKKITGGRLKGMSQICPQWRYKVMTEHYGPIGKGWKFQIVSKDIHEGPKNENGDATKFIFVELDLFVAYDGKWSEAIPGCGGAEVIVKEKYGMHTNTEALKMAVTDALGSAMKMLGVAADVYSGTMAETKHSETYIDYAMQRKCRDIFDQVKEGLTAEQANWCQDMQNRHKYRDVIDYLNGNKK